MHVESQCDVGSFKKVTAICHFDFCRLALNAFFIIFVKMEELLQHHLQSNFPHLKDANLLLAISGGIDSMVMAELFHKLGYNFSIAHCNFQLRGTESFLDQQFVKSFAEKNLIPFYTTIFDTKAFAEDYKLSIQMAARELRYNWFYELAAENAFDYILTAHHSDDNLETFLINLSRGTGIDGLTGIPQQNEKIIRPILLFSRKQIEDFAAENNIEWREDSSNASDKYIRNKIRHDLVPILIRLFGKHKIICSKPSRWLKMPR